MKKMKLACVCVALGIIVFGGIVSNAEETDADWYSLYSDYLYQLIGGEYDEMVAYGDLYCLCYKNESGFSTTAEYYGIYDINKEEWVVEYMEIPGLSSTKEIKYAGAGVFSQYNGRGTVFISVEYGGSFTIDGLDSVNSNGCFYGGYLYGSCGSGKDYTQIVVTPSGEITETPLSNYSGIMHDVYYNEYGYVFWITPFNDFNDKHVVFYLYNKMDAVEIPVEYANRFTGDSEASIGLHRIYLHNLLGDDGRYYDVNFDYDGNLIQDAVISNDSFEAALRSINDFPSHVSNPALSYEGYQDYFKKSGWVITDSYNEDKYDHYSYYGYNGIWRLDGSIIRKEPHASTSDSCWIVLDASFSKKEAMDAYYRCKEVLEEQFGMPEYEWVESHSESGYIPSNAVPCVQYENDGGLVVLHTLYNQHTGYYEFDLNYYDK